MRISPKVLLKTTARFIRRNKSQILKIAASLATLAATGLAVKEGIKAKERIDEKQEELQQTDPEAVLPKKEKVKIVVKTCVPSFILAALSIASIQFLYSGLAAEVSAATGAAAYYAARDTPGDDKEELKSASQFFKEENLDNIKFDVYEPVTKSLIKDVTIKKLIVTEYMTNKIYNEEREMFLDWVVEFLGGSKLSKDDHYRFIWDYGSYDAYINPPDMSCTWITFKPCLDGDRIILLFDTPPRDIYRNVEDDDDIVKKSYDIYGDRILQV